MLIQQMLKIILMAGPGLLIGAGQSASGEQRVSIHCRIVSDIGDEAVNRARLTLSGSGLPEPLITYSSDKGDCLFEGVPAGRYNLGVEKAGYFPLTGGKSVEIEAAAGSTVNVGEIVLVAMRSIAGSVRWATGDPADRVIVHALLAKRAAASFRPGDARMVMTNSRGEYRLEGLLPGRYVVYSYTLGLADAGTRPRLALPVYYPDMSEPSSGSAIDLRESAEATGIDMALTEASGVKITGTVTASASLPEGFPIAVGMQINGSPAQPVIGTRTKIGARFQILGVPPGSYTMIIVPDSRPNLRSFYPLAVGSHPIVDLVIPFAESKSIHGAAEFQPRPRAQGSNRDGTDGGATGESCPKFRLLAQSDKLGLFGVMVSETGENCQFRLDGAASGEAYNLTVLQGPKDAYMARVRQGQQELAGAPFSIAEGAGQVEILWKRDAATINGRLATNRNPIRGFIVLAPNDRARGHLYRTATVKRDGTFQLEVVAPGEYRMYPLEQNEEDAYLDGEYLRKFDKRSIPVSVGPGTTLAVTVELP